MTSGAATALSSHAIGDRWRLAWLRARRGLRQTWRGVTAPFRLVFHRRGAGADTLVVAPQDLRTTDPTVASDIYAGYFAFAGKVAASGGRSPFELEPPSPAWLDALMGF